MAFKYILDKFLKDALSEKDKGDKWLWIEFSFRKDFGGQDTGVDLVAYTYNGDYWAIQCKCYAENTTIGKPAVDSFLSTSSRSFMDTSGKTATFAHLTTG